MDGNSANEGLAKKGQSDADSNNTSNLRKIKEEPIEDEEDQVVEEFFVKPELVEEVIERHFLTFRPKVVLRVHFSLFHFRKVSFKRKTMKISKRKKRRKRMH